MQAIFHEGFPLSQLNWYENSSAYALGCVDGVAVIITSINEQFQ